MPNWRCHWHGGPANDLRLRTPSNLNNMATLVHARAFVRYDMLHSQCNLLKSDHHQHTIDASTLTACSIMRESFTAHTVFNNFCRAAAAIITLLETSSGLARKLCVQCSNGSCLVTIPSLAGAVKACSETLRHVFLLKWHLHNTVCNRHAHMP